MSEYLDPEYEDYNKWILLTIEESGENKQFYDGEDLSKVYTLAGLAPFYIKNNMDKDLYKNTQNILYSMNDNFYNIEHIVVPVSKDDETYTNYVYDLPYEKLPNLKSITKLIYEKNQTIISEEYTDKLMSKLLPSA